MRLLCTSLLAVMLLVAAVPDAVARPTELRKTYQGATPFGAAAVRDECAGETALRLGVVCLVVPAGARTMSFSVNDASRLAVGGTYYVYDASGEVTAADTHCGSGGAPVVPGGTVVVRMELINGPLVCLAEGLTGGEATRGYVQFILR